MSCILLFYDYKICICVTCIYSILSTSISKQNLHLMLSFIIFLSFGGRDVIKGHTCGDAQLLFLTLCSRITPSSAQGP